MNNNYKIILKSTSGGATGEFINTGVLTEEFGEKALSYTSYSDEVDYETKIILGKDMVSVINSGSLTSVFNFEQGKTHDSSIVTEYGSLPVSIKTNSIHRIFSEDSIFLKIEYQTFISDKPDNFIMEISAQKI